MSGDWRRTTLILFEVGVNRVFDRFTYPCMYVWRSRHPLEQPYLLPATASSGKGALARVIVVLASLPPQLSLLLLILAWSRQRDLLWHEQFFSRYPHGTNSRENQVIFRETKKKKEKKKKGKANHTLPHNVKDAPQTSLQWAHDFVFSLRKWGGSSRLPTLWVCKVHIVKTIRDALIAPMEGLPIPLTMKTTLIPT